MNVAVGEVYCCFSSLILIGTSIVGRGRIHLSFSARVKRWGSA
jgi:hypothetical protein